MFLVFQIVASFGQAQAQVQSLEPRLLSPAPVGMNFLILTYVHSSGDIVLASTIPLEDTKARLNSGAAVYVRSIGFLGKAGRVTAVVPFANTKWSGDISGVDTSTTRTGFGDPLIGIGVGFFGTPALHPKDLATFRPGTMAAASLRISVPLGQYDDSRFFNLGTNRWQFIPGLAAMQYVGRWGFEAQLRAWFSTTNPDFYGGTDVGQEPLVGFQLHVEYTFKRGLWAAASFGQSFGGATVVDGESQENDQTNNRFGLTLDYPLGKTWSVKGAYSGGISTRYGGDFDTFALGLQHHWGGGM
jgi:hypothetical protein